MNSRTGLKMNDPSPFPSSGAFVGFLLLRVRSNLTFPVSKVMHDSLLMHDSLHFKRRICACLLLDLSMNFPSWRWLALPTS